MKVVVRFSYQIFIKRNCQFIAISPYDVKNNFTSRNIMPPIDSITNSCAVLYIIRNYCNLLTVLVTALANYYVLEQIFPFFLIYDSSSVSISSQCIIYFGIMNLDLQAGIQNQLPDITPGVRQNRYYFQWSTSDFV